MAKWSATHKMENGDDQHPILRSVKQTYPWLFSVFTMNANGQVIGQSDEREKKDYKNRIYFQQVKSGNDIGQKVLIGRMTGEPAYALSAPIKDASGGLQGVIAMSASLADISQTIVNTKIGETGFAFVVDQNGKVIAHWKKELSEKLQDYSQHPAVARALGNTERKIEFTDDKGNNIISFSRKTNRFNWTVVVQQNEEEVYASIREADKQALVLLIVTLVSVIVIAYIAAQRLSIPIIRLTQAANDISRGQFTQISEKDRGDEIGSLAHAIERMSVSIRIAIERMRKASHNPKQPA